ncbi:hypothetical protein JMJ35_010722 [Cladonia borealis]|uniref:Major facilitator superfamily (MFS) profile domain-containing protein n=1 Tax=Cladonia borealis TaxID=184061 RepID=A0AA39QPR1_9LECA|nr:hypothetical protein JMJ35_010722 [Cladonia borealis]
MELNAVAQATEEIKGEDSIDNEDSRGYPSGARLLIVTVGMMAVILMVALDNYILATAIPRITTQFKSLGDVGWYASSYFLTQMALQPAFGHLYTDYSVKAVYIVAIVIFKIGSMVYATADSSETLIVGRLIAGGGGAGLYVGTLALVGYTVPIRKRPVYISIVTSMFGIASVAGPLLGGLFTDTPKLTGRFCFWINLPIGFVAFLFISILYQEGGQIRKKKPAFTKGIAKCDLISVCLLISAFICLLLALQWADITYAWSDSHVYGCLLGFGLLLGAFIFVQIWKTDNTIIPFSLLSQRTVAASSSFLLFISMAVLGVSACESGFRNLPFLITLLFSPMASGVIISWSGFYVPFMWLGAALATIGSGLLFTLKTDSSRGAVAGYQFIVGFGLGMCNQIPFNAVQYILPPSQMVMGSAIVSFSNSLGPIFGTSIGQAIFASLYVRRLKLLPGVDGAAVVRAGTTNLAAMVPEATLPAVREA